jgi:hypothetical protein
MAYGAVALRSTSDASAAVIRLRPIRASGLFRRREIGRIVLTVTATVMLFVQTTRAETNSVNA